MQTKSIDSQRAYSISATLIILVLARTLICHTEELNLFPHSRWSEVHVIIQNDTWTCQKRPPLLY
jgi:hypothetical protein